VSTSRSSGSLWPASFDHAASSGISSNNMYWWLITIIGTSRPNILPTSAARYPAALMTISQRMSPCAVETIHSPLSRRTPVTGQKRMILAPMSRAPLASAWVSWAGSMSPSLGS